MRPILLLDVDGVINLFGFGYPVQRNYDKHLAIDGVTPLFIPKGTRERLSRLVSRFDIVWCTMWEHEANQQVEALWPELIDGDPWPVIEFESAWRDIKTTWKLPDVSRWVTEHARGRPIAWLDDELKRDADAWARELDQPTKLVRSRSLFGLTDWHVIKLLHFASRLEPTE